MGSKGRMLPPHLRRPLPGPGMMHPDPFGPGIRPPPGAYPFDMLPPPELMEQKLAAQHAEMQRLATENQRLAGTHAALRQELAATQQELQRLQAHMGAMKNEREQVMRGLLDKISKMDADLQSAEPIKIELHQARTDAQSLITARQELISKVQQLTQDLQRSRADSQQIPTLMSELEGLRQEYQHCRATYDHEKKLYNDYIESLQVMEKNYVSMAREVEKLRAELVNTERNGGSYGGATPYKESDTPGHHSVGQTAYEDGYGVPQGRGPTQGSAASYGGVPPGAAAARAGYNAPTRGGAGYEAPARGGGVVYDAQAARGGVGYDAQGARGGAGYDAQAARGGAGYDAQARGGAGYDAVPRGGPGYDAARGAGYDAPVRGAGGPPQAAVAPGNAGPYGSSVTPTRAGGQGGGYEAKSRGGNTVRR
ncbi:protein FLX-like 2 [Tasmannia lanceolata]|uniref:protein FLX-like 2 n=1 Tax=Tasmannia lanceolata TaxID=3420 RepID=UPI00406340C3